MKRLQARLLPMMSALTSLRTFVVQLLRRFVEEDFLQLSAGLAFTTLLSLVPLVAVVLGIMSVFPFFLDMAVQLDNFVVRSVLPESSAGMIIFHVLQFSQKAANVTLAGLAALIPTVVFLLFSVERAFNRVWRAPEKRVWWRRLGLYVIVLALWPFVITCVIFATYHAVISSLGVIDSPAWLHQPLLKTTGLLVAALFLAGLYTAVPNALVRWRDALWAGLFAASAFALMKDGFELYLSYFPSITLVYGAFATLPIFLTWVYLSWAVVLLGALLAALLAEFRGSDRQG